MKYHRHQHEEDNHSLTAIMLIMGAYVYEWIPGMHQPILATGASSVNHSDVDQKDIGKATCN